jgi:hypothetical protein
MRARRRSRTAAPSGAPHDDDRGRGLLRAERHRTPSQDEGRREDARVRGSACGSHGAAAGRSSRRDGESGKLARQTSSYVLPRTSDAATRCVSVCAARQAERSGAQSARTQKTRIGRIQEGAKAQRESGAEGSSVGAAFLARRTRSFARRCGRRRAEGVQRSRTRVPLPARHGSAAVLRAHVSCGWQAGARCGAAAASRCRPRRPPSPPHLKSPPSPSRTLNSPTHHGYLARQPPQAGRHGRAPRLLPQCVGRRAAAQARQRGREEDASRWHGEQGPGMTGSTPHDCHTCADVAAAEACAQTGLQGTARVGQARRCEWVMVGACARQANV